MQTARARVPQVGRITDAVVASAGRHTFAITTQPGRMNRSVTVGRPGEFDQRFAGVYVPDTTGQMVCSVGARTHSRHDDLALFVSPVPPVGIVADGKDLRPVGAEERVFDAAIR